MFRSRTRGAIALAGLAVPAAVLLAGSPAVAAAAVAPEDVVNTETVQARLDATGAVTEARVYEQVAVTGDGEVTIVNPVSTKGLRNLDGFGGVRVEDGDMVSTLDVRGEARLRTVSDYDQDLPLTVAVVYLLDGREAAPGDVVGRSGDLEVRYTVTNTTATTQAISFDDGTGTQMQEDAEVVIPMVGSLTTTLPPDFTDVASDQANIAGDGRGGTKLTFTMTLFPPIGSATAEFGYVAKISDGVVPPATVSALPVRPLQSPSFAGGAESYAGGAETGAKLTAGATEIDANLLKLRDGASDLLAGLTQLSAGAEQLRAGLQGTAAPGASTLAAGAEQAAHGADDLLNGASRLDSGAGELATGAVDLDAGADTLAAGSAQLRDGLGAATAGAPTLLGGLDQVRAGLTRLDAGLAQLSAGVGALETDPGVQQLRGGIQQVITGIGSNAADGTLLYGLARVDGGLSNPDGVIGDTTNPPGIKEGLEKLKAELGEREAGRALVQLETVLGCNETTCTGVTDPTAAATSQAIVNGLEAKLAEAGPGISQMLTGVARLQAGVDQLECGLDSAAALATCDATRPGVKQGLQQSLGGVEQLIDSVIASVQGAVGTPQTSATTTLRGGVAALAAGTDQLRTGGATLSGGLGQLSDGSTTLAAGAGELAAGTEKLKDGAGQLSDGTGRLADGAGRLADGTGRIADGAGELAAGLGDAGDGSAQLADGLVQAEAGAPQLVDGAQRLSDEGTSQLVEAGSDTAQEFGAKYALVAAVNQRATDEGMAYGAPDGARGATAYSLELAGVDGEGSRNVGRALGALGVFGLGAGLVAAVRGRLV